MSPNKLYYIVTGGIYMQKTKLGISVGLLGAAIYFLGLVGGYVITGLLVGYVLLFEENIWLKKLAVKVVALMLLFSILESAVGLIPGTVDFVNSIFYVFDGEFTLTALTRIVLVIKRALTLTQTVLFLMLGFKSLSQGSIRISMIDNLVSKYMD